MFSLKALLPLPPPPPPTLLLPIPTHCPGTWDALGPLLAGADNVLATPLINTGRGQLLTHPFFASVLLQQIDRRLSISFQHIPEEEEDVQIGCLMVVIILLNMFLLIRSRKIKFAQIKHRN